MRASISFLIAAVTITAPSLVLANVHKEISESKLTQLLQENGLLFTVFSSPVHTSWETLHTLLDQASTNLSVPFASVDCDVELSLCADQDVHVYPTFRLFSKEIEAQDAENPENPDTDAGVHIEDADLIYAQHQIHSTRYRSPRTPHAIRMFVSRHALPVLSRIHHDQLAAFKQTDDIVLVAYLDAQHTVLLQAWTEVAQRYAHRFVFGYIITSSVQNDEREIAQEEITEPNGKASAPSVVMYKALDADHQSFEGQFSTRQMVDWIDATAPYAIRTFRERDVEKFMIPHKLTIYIFLPSSSSIALESSLRQALTPLARSYAQHTIFTLAQLPEYTPMAERFGLHIPPSFSPSSPSSSPPNPPDDPHMFPALVIHAPMNDHVFVYKQGREIHRADVERMLVAILRGEARNGQVFFGEEEHGGGHDEL